ncbi:hypothetical protein NX059_006769 [Plenodomus lindquistii]|nr:hypothetical protein NX059_006769 [Plenodomus lindquistii]
MRSSIFVSAVAFAVASAQSSSVDPAPQTQYLTQTNSLGVVTGGPAADTAIPTQPAADTAIPTQPGVVTEQPAVVTEQPLPDNIPAVGTGLHTLTLAGTGSAFNETRTVTVSANNSTTLVVAPATTASGSGASATGSGATASGASRSGSQTGSGASSSATGAAAQNFNAAAGGILGFGAFMAAFL